MRLWRPWLPEPPCPLQAVGGMQWDIIPAPAACAIRSILTLGFLFEHNVTLRKHIFFCSHFMGLQFCVCPRVWQIQNEERSTTTGLDLRFNGCPCIAQEEYLCAVTFCPSILLQSPPTCLQQKCLPVLQKVSASLRESKTHVSAL